MENKRYGAIDGMRMLAAFGILMMHMRSFNEYQISGHLYNTVIASFGDFVFLFIAVSAFGMCCGYYDKVLNGKISLASFYGKRFKKVLPFFAVLVLIDVIREPTMANLCEAFADLTLVFGFLQKTITVIGVGWFLGLVFVFYLCFPFFCVLIENKRRAWLAFAVSLAYNFVCTSYFDVGRENILYSACFFLAGGLIYLYREDLVKVDSRIVFVIVCCAIALYYLAGRNAIIWLPVSAALLIYAISKRGGVLDNKVTRFFSSISMEIYLSHMAIFRVIEKLNLNRIIGNGWIQYLVTVTLVIAGATVFAVIMKRLWGGTVKLIQKESNTL